MCCDLQPIAHDGAVCTRHELSACEANYMIVLLVGLSRCASEGASVVTPELSFASRQLSGTHAAEHHDLKADHLSACAIRVRASGLCTHRWGSAGTCARRATSNMVRSSTEM